MVGLSTLAQTLLALDGNTIYREHLEPMILAPNRHDVLIPLVAEVLTGSHAPGRGWICDVLSYLPLSELERLSALAVGCEAPSPSPPVDGDVSSIVAYLLGRDSVPESVIETCALQLGRPTREDARALPVEPLASPFHWTIAVEARVLTARTSACSMARRLHPTWVLDHAPVATCATLGSARTTVGGCIALFSVDRPGLLSRSFGDVERLDVLVPIDGLHATTCGYSGTSVIHDEAWRPVRTHRADDFETTPPFRPNPVLVTCDVRIVPTATRYLKQSWGNANGLQNLNRLFGRPTFVQHAYHPACISCGHRMPLLLQMETGMPCVDGFDLVEEGVVYGFVCVNCRVTTWLAQCT